MNHPDENPENLFLPQHLVEIPPIFFSVEFDGPFRQCQICSRGLLDEGESYLIEKVFRGTETIVEIATCMSCAIEMQSEISEESSLVLHQEFEQKVNIGQRLQWLDRISESSSSAFEPDGTDPQTGSVTDAQDSESDGRLQRPDQSLCGPERWLDTCVLNGTPRTELDRFQIAGQFIGDRMVLSVFPYLISGAAVEELGEKLSERTKGFMRDFVGDQFGMPPEFCQPDGPLPILL